MLVVGTHIDGRVFAIHNAPKIKFYWVDQHAYVLHLPIAGTTAGDIGEELSQAFFAETRKWAKAKGAHTALARAAHRMGLYRNTRYSSNHVVMVNAEHGTTPFIAHNLTSRTRGHRSPIGVRVSITEGDATFYAVTDESTPLLAACISIASTSPFNDLEDFERVIDTMTAMGHKRTKTNKWHIVRCAPDEPE